MNDPIGIKESQTFPVAKLVQPPVAKLFPVATLISPAITQDRSRKPGKILLASGFAILFAGLGIWGLVTLIGTRNDPAGKVNDPAEAQVAKVDKVKGETPPEPAKKEDKGTNESSQKEEVNKNLTNPANNFANFQGKQITITGVVKSVVLIAVIKQANIAA